MDKIIKILLALLLFICLADMPYGYYQLVRFVGLIGFSILAYKAYEHNKKNPKIMNEKIKWIIIPRWPKSITYNIYRDAIVTIPIVTMILKIYKNPKYGFLMTLFLW